EAVGEAQAASGAQQAATPPGESGAQPVAEPAGEAREPASAPEADQQPAEAVDTRFALIDEFRALGDTDMARDLLREIVAESDGPTRARAEAMLAELG
ncbi:FimV/HubP family polar landmark protein, partial [Thiomonas sp.]|uniref:FimV/HubP family polar landmark protein n=1 Tax=Thiomonas sp. TaxID=2047785 RepID=UPI00262D03B6